MRIKLFFVLFLTLFYDTNTNIIGHRELLFRNYSLKIVVDKIVNSFHLEVINHGIEKFRLQNSIKGLAVAIVKDEKLIYAKGFGYADQEKSILMSPDMLFRVASVSKLITAVAIMKLVESKKITLDSYVFGKYGILNDGNPNNTLKDKRLEKITVRHLLNHSGGWTQRYGDPAFLPFVIAEQNNEKLPLTIDSYIKFVCSRNLHFEPGTISAYSNIGYLFLGEIISRISKMPYEKYVRENVLKKSNITDMFLGGSFESDKLFNEVRYYMPDDAEPVECFDGTGRLVPKIYGGNNIKLLGSAGGWIASPVDLMKLLVTIDGNNQIRDILSSQSISEMTMVNSNGLDPLGWRSTNEYGEWWRTGTLPGSSALMKRQSNGISWAIISNTSNYKGPSLALGMDRAMTTILQKIDSWPDVDLFDFYIR